MVPHRIKTLLSTHCASSYYDSYKPYGVSLSFDLSTDEDGQGVCVETGDGS